jgi:hypothetical protein
MEDYVYTDQDGETLKVYDYRPGDAYIETHRAVVVPAADLPGVVAKMCEAAGVPPRDVFAAIDRGEVSR